MYKLNKTITALISVTLLTALLVPVTTVLDVTITTANAVAFPAKRVANTKAPWAVQIYANSLAGAWWPASICTGALIENYYVITAAHCLDGRDPSQLLVGVGGTNGDNIPKIQVADFAQHTSFTRNDFWQGNDIALLRLATPTDVTPIKVTGVNDRKYRTKPQSMALYGWGIDQNGDDASRLGYTKQSDYGTKIKKWYTEFRPKFEIAAGLYNDTEKGFAGACSGDSGGPLVGYTTKQQPVLLGITSYGKSDCISAPTIYTRVAAYLDWINQTKQQLTDKANTNSIPYQGLDTFYNETSTPVDTSDASITATPDVITLTMLANTATPPTGLSIQGDLDANFDGIIDGHINTNGLYLTGSIEAVAGCAVTNTVTSDTVQTIYTSSVTTACVEQTFGTVADYTLTLVGSDGAQDVKVSDGWWLEYVMLLNTDNRISLPGGVY